METESPLGDWLCVHLCIAYVIPLPSFFQLTAAVLCCISTVRPSLCDHFATHVHSLWNAVSRLSGMGIGKPFVSVPREMDDAAIGEAMSQNQPLHREIVAVGIDPERLFR